MDTPFSSVSSWFSSFLQSSTDPPTQTGSLSQHQQQPRECCCEYGPLLEPPKDEDGYVVSFRPSDATDIFNFFEEYGFVVVRDWAPMELIDALDDELLKSNLFDGKNPCENPEKVNWDYVYNNKYNMAKGFVNVPATGPSACRVRQLPEILSVFSLILGRPEIYTRIDRFGLMRPTINHPDWATETGFVHWDQNPTKEPNFSRVQGIIALTEHTETSGGFHCIPGSSKWMKKYGENNNCAKDGLLVNCVGECLLQNHLFRVTARKGSFIIWDSRTAHGNWPNQRSPEWRRVCYMTFFPRPEKQEFRKSLKNKAESRLPDESIQVLTKEGEQIFALREYPEDAKRDGERAEGGKNEEEERGVGGDGERKWLVDLDAHYANFQYI